MKGFGRDSTLRLRSRVQRRRYPGAMFEQRNSVNAAGDGAIGKQRRMRQLWDQKKTLAWLDLTGEKGRRYRLVVGRIPSPDL